MESKLVDIPPPAPGRTSIAVARPAGPPAFAGGSPLTGPLKNTRALALKDGEAQLLVSGSARFLRVGDAFGTDIVKSISAGRIVLERPDGADPKMGRAFVIVDFDPLGLPRTRVISMKDPTLPAPIAGHR